MAIISKLFPNRLYKWTILFYVSFVIFFVLIIITSNIGLPGELLIIMMLVLSLLATFYLIRILFSLFSTYQNRQSITFKVLLVNTLLFVITIPIVAGYLFIGFRTAKTTQPLIASVWQDITHKNLDYQKLESFPALCGNFPLNTRSFAITNDQEYEVFMGKSYMNSDTCKGSSFPEINFNDNMLLISSISHGHCDTVSEKVYQDDSSKRIIYVTNIRNSTGFCTMQLDFTTEAILVPKLQGYTPEFQVDYIF